MAKKVEVEKIDVKRGPLQLNVKCGSCMFLNRAGAYANSKGGVTCASFGTVSSSDPCRWYTPDPKQVRNPEGTSLGEMLDKLTDCRNAHGLAAALLSRGRVRRLGFELGEEVYFHVMGGDYICNYSAGRIIGSVHNTLIIEGLGCIGHFKPDSVMHVGDWDLKLGRLLKANKINDPEGGLRKVGRGNDARLEKYVPPYMKTAPASKHSVKKRGRKKKAADVIILS
jgi:hypothetical protein